MKSFESSKTLAPTLVGLFHRVDGFSLAIRINFSSMILINEIFPSDVAFRRSSSVLTNETDTLFRKLSRN